MEKEKKEERILEGEHPGVVGGTGGGGVRGTRSETGEEGPGWVVVRREADTTLSPSYATVNKITTQVSTRASRPKDTRTQLPSPSPPLSPPPLLLLQPPAPPPLLVPPQPPLPSKVPNDAKSVLTGGLQATAGLLEPSSAGKVTRPPVLRVAARGGTGRAGGGVSCMGDWGGEGQSTFSTQDFFTLSTLLT
ncbi:hypothetical protein E2C01_058053 [Portunus trituberculatus]|uniref:Uncharacterized protein n=1 Tax=Portunus trituberculatus TaxID=210409 RepID=A0A5B7H513_PORTR|nr:hypothetical protein [Portunus trituberculatus]